MFFGRTAQKSKFWEKTKKSGEETEKTYPQFLRRKSGENGLIHGIINFIHNFGDKNAEFVEDKKNKRFVSF